MKRCSPPRSLFRCLLALLVLCLAVPVPAADLGAGDLHVNSSVPILILEETRRENGGPKRQPNDPAGEVCVRDDTGQLLCLERPASAIVPLYASFGEILTALEVEGVVAATVTDPTPGVPRIGTHIRPNLELVTAARPDLVIQTGGRAEAMESVQALRRLGIPVAVFNLHGFPDLFAAIERIGVLTGNQSRASRLERELRGRLDRVERLVARRDTTPTVLFEVRYPNYIAAGQEAMVSDIIRLAGGRNAVHGAGKLARISEEIILSLDPDVYLVQTGPMNKNPLPVTERPRFRQLKAVRDGRVLVVAEDLFSRPGPRNVDAVEALAAWLHPDLFPANAPALE